VDCALCSRNKIREQDIWTIRSKLGRICPPTMNQVSTAASNYCDFESVDVKLVELLLLAEKLANIPYMGFL